METSRGCTFSIETTKICSKCCVEKPATKEFFIYSSTHRGGLHTLCKVCQNEYQRNYYVKNIMKIRKRRSEWKKRSSTKVRRYNMTAEEYDSLISIQNNKCAICGLEETLVSKNGEVWSLAIDHDHETGEVRGLLCSGCNMALGKFHDDPIILRRAVEYIEGKHLFHKDV